MLIEEQFVEHTKNWINNVVIASNFCPFASKVMRARKLHFRIESSEILSICLEALLDECERLDKNPAIETTLILYPYTFHEFDHYLKFVELAEKLIVKHDYEGIYQVASFHPDYCFEGEDENDPANYTNRSPYPMLHILREASLTKVLGEYPDAHKIPGRNIRLSRERGEIFMRQLLHACFS